MSQYQDVILQALIIFPIIALLFTLPYALYNYHKFGSFLSMRIAIVYSFILYLICAYFLVILPLPPKEWVANLTTPMVQLTPFQFIRDIQASTFVSFHQPISLLRTLNHSAVYQVIFNLALSAPLGMYLRYYFQCNWKKTLLFSFLLALFFELTQLSGLYGIYPRGYRLFDVDDLIINTLGGMIGYLIIKPFMKVLPTREAIDDASYARGIEVSLPRRILAFIIDVCLLFTLTSLIHNLIAIPYLFNSCLILYFLIVPTLFKGKTFGKIVTNTKVSTTNERFAFYQPFLRYTYLYASVLIIPTFVYWYLETQYDQNIVHLNTFFLLTGLLFAFIVIYLSFALIEIARDKPLFYERWSHTKIISTIAVATKTNTEKEHTTMNKQLPYYDIIMKANPLQNVDVLPLPEGYSYKTYEEGDQQHWAALEKEVDEFSTIDDALTYFNRVFKPHQEELRKRMFFILDDKQQYVATASAWFKMNDQRRYALLHWVSVSPSQQGKGLGKAITQYALAKFKDVEPNEQEVFLHTQTWSYKAIGIYAQYGFKITKTPLLEEVTDFACINVLQEVLPAKTMQMLLAEEE